jgi:thioesterase domain-containing protein
VRWRADGTVEFLGRLDQQVKIRGFRVEPGEVESVLAAHPGVRDAAVVAVPGEQGDMRLVSYFVPRDPADGATRAAPVTPSALRSYLKDRVPDYMVPVAFVAMEALPIGATGKLDRRALPVPDAASASTERHYVAPRTTIEHQFVQTWEALLPHRPIGIQDDFFELGGHSLLAIRMLAEIERVTGRRLPLATLFEGATIEHLATCVESAMHAEQEPPYVVLNTRGRQSPIVFLHGDVTGGGWYCRRLAPLLDVDAPMIVLPTLREQGPNPPASVQDMARHHVATLRRLQPTGPYRLVGYCAGGAIAYEMACLLADEGASVERLVLIDSVAANARFRYAEWLVNLLSRAPTYEAHLDRRAKLLRKMGYYSSRIRALRRVTLSERLHWAVKNVRTRIPGLASELGDRTLDPQSEAAMRAADFDARPGQDVLRFHSRAARAYIPRRYRGSVDLVVAVDPNHDAATARLLASSRRGWGLVAGDVRVHPVQSSHVGLITDQIAQLAARLRQCLPASSSPS